MAVRGLAILLDRTVSGGIERYSADIVRLTAPVVDWTIVEPARIKRVTGGSVFSDAVAVARAARTVYPSLIFADRLHILPYGLLARSLTSSCRLTVATYGTEVTSPSKRWMKRQVLNRADHIISCSDWSARQTSELLHTRHVPVTLHPGVDTESLRRPDAWNGESYLASVGIAHTFPTLLTVARLSRNARHKGLDRTAQAVGNLTQQGVAVHWIIVGSGDDERWVDEQIQRYGAESVTTRMGHIDDEQLALIRWSSDLFCLPTVPTTDGSGAVSVEGFGISFVEAAASGLWSIGTALAGSAESIAEGVSGTVVGGSASTIRDAIMRHTANQAEPRRRSAERWASQFNWATRINETLSAIGLPTA